MAKRDNTGNRQSTAGGEEKRSKRKQHARYAKAAVEAAMPLSSEVKEEIINIDDVAMKVEHEEEVEDEVDEEEEVLCDGEIEMDSNDDNADNIDVETADTEILEVNTNLPIKAISSTSKHTAKGGSKLSPNNSTISTSSPSNSVSSVANTTGNPAAPLSNNKRNRKRKESGTSSDEERWLTAIESGKLEEVDDELKKIKDPKLMTARQRAMYERSSEAGGELLMSLPIGYREREKPQTAEDIQKAVLKSQKRKQQADEKREKDKKKTMERLLKKQESKLRASARNKNLKTCTPMIVYINNAEGAYIHMPADYEFPLKAQTEREPPKVQLCGIVACGKAKAYNCSKTNMPLCSFNCYRKNVQSAKKIMC